MEFLSMRRILWVATGQPLLEYFGLNLSIEQREQERLRRRERRRRLRIWFSYLRENLSFGFLRNGYSAMNRTAIEALIADTEANVENQNFDESDRPTGEDDEESDIYYDLTQMEEDLHIMAFNAAN